MLTLEEYTGFNNHRLRYGKLINPERPPTDKALLFVPGLGGSVKGALTFLNELLPHYHCIYGPDLRSFGLNPVETPLYSIQPIFEDLKSFLQMVNQQPHSQLDLCGISMGGVISVMLATEHADWSSKGFHKLVLLVPAFLAHTAKFTPRYILGNLIGRLLKGKNFTTTLPYGIETLTQNHEILTDPQFAETPPQPLSLEFLLNVRTLGQQAMRNMRQLHLPTLMVIADQDFVCDPAAMRKAFDRIPESTPKLRLDYPDLYHDILFEREAGEIAHRVADWLIQPNSTASHTYAHTHTTPRPSHQSQV